MFCLGEIFLPVCIYDDPIIIIESHCEEELGSMSTACHYPSEQKTTYFRLNGDLAPRTSPVLSRLKWLAFLLCSFLLWVPSNVWGEDTPLVSQSELLKTVREYAESVGKGDRVTAGQHDFVCLLKMAQQQQFSDGGFPDPLSPIYEWCDQRRRDAHHQVINKNDRALDNVWPGPGKVVDFSDFQRFFIAETRSQQLAPSFFVMYDIAVHEPAMPFTIEALESGSLPHASFPSADEATVLAAPTAFVTTRVSYPNPLTAPISNGPGTEDWVVPYKKVQQVMKSVKVKWVVLSGLKPLGFPVDRAVLDLPLDGPHGTTVPFVVDPGGYISHSTEWFGPEDHPEAVQTGIQEAQTAPTILEAVMRMNRILMIAPSNKQALEVFADQLYKGLMNFGSRSHGIQLEDERLAQRFNELYWTVQS